MDLRNKSHGFGKHSRGRLRETGGLLETPDPERLTDSITIATDSELKSVSGSVPSLSHFSLNKLRRPSVLSLLC